MHLGNPRFSRRYRYDRDDMQGCFRVAAGQESDASTALIMLL